MKDRSQSINRFLARRELVERIERLSGKLTTDDIKKLKKKKQKSKRQKRAREKYQAGDTGATPVSEGNFAEANEDKSKT